MSFVSKAAFLNVAKSKSFDIEVALPVLDGCDENGDSVIRDEKIQVRIRQLSSLEQSQLIEMSSQSGNASLQYALWPLFAIDKQDDSGERLFETKDLNDLLAAFTFEQLVILSAEIGKRLARRPEVKKEVKNSETLAEDTTADSSSDSV